MIEFEMQADMDGCEWNPGCSGTTQRKRCKCAQLMIGGRLVLRTETRGIRAEWRGLLKARLARPGHGASAGAVVGREGPREKAAEAMM